MSTGFPLSPEKPASPLANIADLVRSAETEVSDVITSESTATGIKGELDEAKAIVDSKQQELDAARATVANEKAEAITALRQISDAVAAQIAKLEATV